MFVGVRPCVILFRHFFVLVKSGKGKDEVGAYYFQTRSDLRTPYIPGLVGGKREDWRKEWVIATTEANEPVLEGQAVHLLGDFLKRRIAPLKQRPRPAWSFTGLQDCSRTHPG